MAATITAGRGVTSMVSDATVEVAGGERRQISPEAGRALEILGHAIEYLIDEYIAEGGAFSPQDPQMQAVRLLMTLNQEIYLACPVVPSLRERVRNFLRRPLKEP